jgi:hypothetical protein
MNQLSLLIAERVAEVERLSAEIARRKKNFSTPP